ncbi:tyrosine-protein phosphatase [Nocardioides alcanivorans]|uniref:tyrosine-protein phosphatase n=1 Tax=Nocardioides alcanivorans TaxID=2897352 RepID=UPI001F42922D|nr:tyrosine-protein phosphatase [Nocardioides alcanivorans]
MQTRKLLGSLLAPALVSAALAVPATAVAPDGAPSASERSTARTAGKRVNQVDVEQRGSGYTVTWAAPGRHKVYASKRPGNPSKSGRLVGTSKWGAVHVKGLTANKRWYFEVAPVKQVKRAKKKRKDVKGVIASTHHLGLDSTSNTRDLGGFRTVDGKTVKWGVLFRGDAVTAPTARDVKVLKGMRLTRSADFRADTEIAKDGANQYDASVKQMAVPLLDDSTTALSDAIQAVIRDGDPAVAEELLGDGKAEEIAATGPAKMMRRPAVRDSFGRILKVLAKKKGAPLIFNCTAGKDRTGVFAAVVLRVLGVPEKPLLADYELSNKYRAAYNDRTYQYLESVGVDADLLRPLMEQSGANLANMFRAIEEDYGTFDKFVKKGLGLDKKTVKRLKANLLVSSME